MQIGKKDDAGNVLSGVKFEIRNSKNELVETIVTNEKGIATTGILPYGKYTYKEVEAPKNIVINTNEISFEIKENNKTVVINVINRSEERHEGKE